MKLKSENGAMLRDTSRSVNSKARRKIRERVLRAWKFKCAYCDKENKPLFLDHILPRSKGGPFRVFNLAAVCNDCNKAKKDFDLESFVTDKVRIEVIKNHMERFRYYHGI